MVQQSKQDSDRILIIFLAIWVLMNLVQAGFMDLHPDEAYYWMYSRFLDWGYFDHPPMVAVFIKIGDSFAHNALSLRFMTVVSTATSIFVLWKLLSAEVRDIRMFIMVISSVVVFHMYGFITTPDSPLLLFTVLFFYAYRKYTERDNYKWAAILAVIIACMLYSKYHAILILFFTVISNLKLFKRPSFWVIIAIALIAFLPHIWWQVQNHYPSFYYHIIDRSADAYQFEFTYQYVLAQLALAGPLVGWYLYRSAAIHKSSDLFTRALVFNFFGIFIFFFISTFKGRVEAHWPLPGLICMASLAYLNLAGRPLPKWLDRLFIGNIVLIIVVRLALIVPIPFLERINFIGDYFGTERWAKSVHAKAGNSPVIFLDSFQLPSKYNYYNNTTSGFAYDSRNYRKNQYDIWPLEDSLRNKRVYYVLQHSEGNKRQDTIETDKGIFYGRRLKGVRLYQKVDISPVSMEPEWVAGSERTVKVKISNPYNKMISFDNEGQQYKCYIEYGYKQLGKLVAALKPVHYIAKKIQIPAKEAVYLDFRIRAPEIPGDYKLIFSIRTEPFYGSRNSSHIGVVVVP
ncbi:ArnT family glycosyltransferase [Pedobacter sp. PWIIR3]